MQAQQTCRCASIRDLRSTAIDRVSAIGNFDLGWRGRFSKRASYPSWCADTRGTGPALRRLRDCQRNLVVLVRTARSRARRIDRRRHLVHRGTPVRPAAHQRAFAPLDVGRRTRADRPLDVRTFRGADRIGVQIRSWVGYRHSAADGHDPCRPENLPRMGPAGRFRMGDILAARRRRVRKAAAACSCSPSGRMAPP